MEVTKGDMDGVIISENFEDEDCERVYVYFSEIDGLIEKLRRAKNER